VARIEVRDGGPYRVEGAVPVVRRRMVVSEHGEPLTTHTTHRFPVDDIVVLCRCGASANKPFCDGTHASNGFETKDAAPPGTYENRQRTYDTPGITVRDDRSICEHAGFCGNRVTNVWKLLNEGATADSITRATVISMVERCPSGALTHEIDGSEVEPELPVQVDVMADGPLAVTGYIPIQLADGTTLEVRNRVTLCRCGGSARKPLCGGSHKDIGFTDA
jgi:CDGSH-type Zn-finger protein